MTDSSAHVPPNSNDDLGARLRKARARASLFGKPLELVKIERFTLLEQVGAGAMGEVFAAYDERLERKVAIKLVRLSDSDPQADQRLLREAQTLAQVSHPNVVQVYDAGMYQGRVFIAMEFIRGQSLAEWLKSVDDLPRRARNREILRHFMDAGRGLQAVHQAGLTHRDFKPQNVVVGDDGRVRVVDFGLARSESEEGEAPENAQATAASASSSAPAASGAADYLANTPVSSLTPRGAVVGTPAYMAPELLSGYTADSLSDQFSFCVALYEALYGERPFRGNTIQELQAEAARGAIINPGRGTKVSAPIRRALVRGLSAEPRARFADMGELLDALDNVPGRRRAVAAAAIAAAVLAGLYAAFAPGPEPVCQGAAAELAPVWNPERRAAVEQAITGTGLPYARDVWPVVASGMDDYAGRWKLTHRDACMAHREGRQSPVMLDKRMACLDRRRTALDSAVVVLAETDAATLKRSADVVQNLPDIDYCSNIEALSAEVPPPEDPDVAKEVRAVREHLSRAAALEHAGRYPEALAIAESLVPEAEDLGYTPLLAEAVLAGGRITMSMGSRAEAAPPLERAARVSLEAGMDTTAVEAFARLLYARGTLTSGGGEADVLAFAPMMEALSERLPRPSFARALLLNNIGTVHMARFDSERARRYFARAATAAERMRGEAPVELLSATQNMAMVTPDPAARAALMRVSLRAHERALGPSHPRTLASRLQSASFIADPGDAHDLLAPTCDQYLRLFPEVEEARRCLYSLAFFAADLGHFSEAVGHLSRLLSLAADDNPVQVALARGYALLWQGRAEAALGEFQAALAALPAEPEGWWVQKTIADARLGEGVSRDILGQHAAAVAALDQAREFYEKLSALHYNTEYRKRLAWTRVALARTLWAAARPDDRARAQELLSRAEDWYRENGAGYEWRLQELLQWRRAGGMTDEAGSGTQSGPEEEGSAAATGGLVQGELPGD